MSPSGSRLVRGDQGTVDSLAHLECSWGRQRSAQHDSGPSIHWTAPSRSGPLCNATYDPLGQSRSTPRTAGTTCPVHPSAVQSWAVGSRRSPNPQTPLAALW